MRILISGNTGFIGTNLSRVIDANEYWSTGIGRNIFDKDFEDAVKRNDIVIHLAALTSVANSFKRPDETFYVNTLGTARVAQLCVKYKKKLIFPSTAAIFYPDLSPYAKSKQLAEEIVKGIMGKTNVVILRLCNVFGPHMNPNSGSIMYNFSTAKEIVVYGDGEQTRDYIHVIDVVEIMKDALKKKWNGKIVDIGTAQAYSTNYIAGLFAYFRGKKIKYQAPRRETKWSIGDTTLLKTLYKKPLITNLEKDIKELCETY